MLIYMYALYACTLCLQKCSRIEEVAAFFVLDFASSSSSIRSTNAFITNDLDRAEKYILSNDAIPSQNIAHIGRYKSIIASEFSVEFCLETLASSDRN